jgi:hypothetical protein
MFGFDDALWCNGTEIVHFDAADLVDVRLTKPVIRELRATLRSDERVAFRKNASDWIRVRVTSGDDVAFVVELVESAVEVHRAAEGAVARRPPLGAELERRRRFH